MLHKPLLKATLLTLIFLTITLTAGCQDFFKRTTLLISGSYETPTPYLTPVANGTPALLVTPYPQRTPIFDGEICLTSAGNQYLLDAGLLYYTFKGLRSEANEVSREDLPPIIDEMREIHADFRALVPPSECEIIAELDLAYEAEVDQSIRGFVAFRNLEPEEVWINYYLNEALFYNQRVEELLARIY
jgi:hypothetical protein